MGPRRAGAAETRRGCGEEAARTARAPLSPREPCEEPRSSPYFGKLRPGERAASCCAAPSARLTSAERNHVRGSHRHKKRRRTPAPMPPGGAERRHRAAPAAPPLLRAPRRPYLPRCGSASTARRRCPGRGSARRRRAADRSPPAAASRITARPALPARLPPSFRPNTSPASPALRADGSRAAGRPPGHGTARRHGAVRSSERGQS